jgi:hypothetical protein
VRDDFTSRLNSFAGAQPMRDDGTNVWSAYGAIATPGTVAGNGHLQAMPELASMVDMGREGEVVLQPERFIVLIACPSPWSTIVFVRQAKP